MKAIPGVPAIGSMDNSPCDRQNTTGDNGNKKLNRYAGLESQIEFDGQSD